MRALRTEVFLDSSFVIALASPTDRYHAKAQEIAGDFEQRKVQFITTRAVLLEIGNALSKPRLRGPAVRLLASLERDLKVEIVPLSGSLYQQGFDLFRKRPDKDWGLTDCLSFVVMRERGLSESVTTDHHFEQAGFRALLRTS
jgi:hypothetical protein